MFFLTKTTQERIATAGVVIAGILWLMVGYGLARLGGYGFLFAVPCVILVYAGYKGARWPYIVGRFICAAMAILSIGGTVNPFAWLDMRPATFFRWLVAGLLTAAFLVFLYRCLGQHYRLRQNPPLSVPESVSTGSVVAVALGGLAMASGVLGLFAAMHVSQGAKKLIEKRHELEAQHTIEVLESGLKAYRKEYGHFPPLPLSGPEPGTPVRSRGPLLAALLGKDPEHNPRSITFLKLHAACDHKDGYDEKDGESFCYDPWGEPYYVLLDDSGAHKIPDPSHPGQYVNDSILIYSSGPDNNPDTWQDNITNWESNSEK
jgi:hypothetical protein